MENISCFRDKSIKFYTEGYACSESLIRAAYECGIIDNKSDIELLNKIASPFGGGNPATGCVCGALVGAQMIIGCLIGRKDITYPNEKLKEVSKNIVDEFKARGHMTCCRAYLPDYNETPEEKYQKCVQTIDDVINILYESILKDIKYKTSV